MAVIKIKARIIFEKVDLIIPGVEQRRFFNWLNDTIDELRARCKNDKYVLVNESETVGIINNLEDDVNVRDLYLGAIVDNIVYNAGAGDEHKSEFVRKGDDAYKYYWGSNKNRIMKKWSRSY